MPPPATLSDTRWRRRPLLYTNHVVVKTNQGYAWTNPNPTNRWPHLVTEVFACTNLTGPFRYKLTVGAMTNVVFIPTDLPMEFYRVRFFETDTGNYSDWNN